MSLKDNGENAENTRFIEKNNENVK